MFLFDVACSCFLSLDRRDVRNVDVLGMSDQCYVHEKLKGNIINKRGSYYVHYEESSG
jgi:hypothetical protein